MNQSELHNKQAIICGELRIPASLFSIIFCLWALFLIPIYIAVAWKTVSLEAVKGSLFSLWGESVYSLIDFQWLYRTWEVLKRIFDWSRYPGGLGLNQQFQLFGHYTAALGWLFILLLSALELGDKILALLGIFLPLNQSGWLKLSLGLGLTSLLVFALGLAGLLFPLVACLLVLFFCTVFLEKFIYQKRWRRISLAKLKPFIMDKISLVLLCLLFLTAANNLAGQLAPERFYDALVYHLSVPFSFIQHHKIYQIPSNFFSNYSMGLEMLFCLGSLLHSEMVSKLLCWFLGLGCCFILFDLGNKYFNQMVGFMAAVMFYTIPIVQVSSWEAAVDLGMTFFVLNAVSAFLKIYSQEPVNKGEVSSGAALPCLYIIVILSSYAVMTKYNAVFWVIPLFLICGYEASWFLNIRRSTLLKNTLIAGIVFLTPLLVYWIKNFVFTGNPFFPYLGSILGTWQIDPQKLNHVLGEQHEKWAHTFAEYLALPWNLTIKGDTGDSLVGPLLLLFLPFLLFIKNLPRYMRIVVILFLFSLVIWLSQTHILRFFEPGLALMCLISCYVVYVATKNSKWLGFVAVVIIFIVSLANMFSGAVLLWGNLDPWGTVLGLESQSNYLKKWMMNSSYDSLEYANKNLPKEAKVLFVGETRGFYLQQNFISCTAYNNNPLWVAIKKSRNIKQLEKALRPFNVDYILYNDMETTRLQMQYDIFPLEREDYPLLREFWEKHLQILYDSKGSGVYRIDFQGEVKGQQLPKAFLPSTRAYQYLRDQQYELALKEYLKAMAVGDVNSPNLCNLSVVYIRLGQYSSALQYAQKSVQLDDQNSVAHENLGMLLMYFGKRERGVRELERASQLEPNNDSYAKNLQQARGY